MRIPANAKCTIIEQMMNREDNLLNVKWLCEAAGVSRSGYYHYLQTSELRKQREQQDRRDFLVILEAYNRRGYSSRLMKKYGLFCPIRKANPYRRMAKALKTDAVADNLLNREFESHGPRSILLTDITYIINGKAPRCYMSTIIDACTKELLAWVLSESLEIDFVLETVEIAIAKHGIETMIHSDLGAHYTSAQFRTLLKDKELRQSMSRRANCWDNAPQESYFGHMKDELNLDTCFTFRDVCNEIKDYIEYYNNYRYQWNLKKMTPVQYRNHLFASIA